MALLLTMSYLLALILLTEEKMYGDVVYQFAPSYLLSSLDAVYHGDLRFISDCKPSTHLCILYNRVGWSSLLIRRKMHWYLIIYKAILGMLPSYICCLIRQKIVEKYFLRSQIVILSLFLLFDLN